MLYLRNPTSDFQKPDGDLYSIFIVTVIAITTVAKYWKLELQIEAVISLFQVNFYIDKNMIHIADTKVDRRFGDFFIRQIHKCEELNRGLIAIKM